MRHIEYTITVLNSGYSSRCHKIKFTVSHYGKQFTPTGCFFTGSTGTILESRGTVLRSVKGRDLRLPEGRNVEGNISTISWPGIKVAIDEYNQKFSKPDILGKHGVVR